MTSQLQQLQAALEEFAGNSRDTAEQLAGFSATFSNQRSEVTSLLQGSTRGTDAQVIAAIDDAERQLQVAQDALAEAAQVAKDYAADI